MIKNKTFHNIIYFFYYFELFSFKGSESVGEDDADEMELVENKEASIGSRTLEIPYLIYFIFRE